MIGGTEGLQSAMCQKTPHTGWQGQLASIPQTATPASKSHHRNMEKKNQTEVIFYFGFVLFILLFLPKLDFISIFMSTFHSFCPLFFITSVRVYIFIKKVVHLFLLELETGKCPNRVSASAI